MPIVKEIVGALDQIMGVKAVFGPCRQDLAFGGRGNQTTNQNGFFSIAKSIAEKALTSPYVIAIGGGAKVPDHLKGRVLDVVRVTSVYGETKNFVPKQEYESHGMEQWPASVVISEVYRVEGLPLLVDDLRLADRTILAAAFDGVTRREEQVEALWRALSEIRISRDWNVRPPDGFKDPGIVTRVGTLYPRFSAAEGQQRWKEAMQIERDRRVAAAAKEINRNRNGGFIVCEGCDLKNSNSSLFDAHHLDPLARGPRWTELDHFAVLCPTCHRWAHCMATGGKYSVLTPFELRAARLKEGT